MAPSDLGRTTRACQSRGAGRRLRLIWTESNVLYFKFGQGGKDVIRLLLPAAFFAILMFPVASSGQTESIVSPADAASVISDLNVAVAYLAKDKLVRSDVAIVDGAACSTARVLNRPGYVEHIERELQEKYPSADQVKKVKLPEFVHFERDVLFKFGASKQSMKLVDGVFAKNPFLPHYAPKNSESVANSVRYTEGKACEIRKIAAVAPDEPATDEEVSWTRCLGFTTLAGAAVMVGNLAVGIGVSSAGLPIPGEGLMMISGAWGWDRVHEGCALLK